MSFLPPPPPPPRKSSTFNRRLFFYKAITNLTALYGGFKLFSYFYRQKNLAKPFQDISLSEMLIPSAHSASCVSNHVTLPVGGTYRCCMPDSSIGTATCPWGFLVTFRCTKGGWNNTVYCPSRCSYPRCPGT